MAEKKSQDNNDNASGSQNRTSRVEAHVRQQEQNNAIFARLFASLDAEHRKLRELEERRSQLIEEMKYLRSVLFAENKKLRQTVAPISGGNPLPIPATTNSARPVVKTGSEKPSGSRTSPIIKSARLERRPSNKSVTIADPPTQSLNTSSRPKANNLSNTREDMLDEIDESALATSVGSNLRTLEQRISNLEEPDILGPNSPHVGVNLPEESLELQPVGFVECSANVAEIVENEHETETETETD
ncbi:GM13149 [Drosophila sechellia]|uniref:GM13149 n=1 Tax=Drosophila sechellia TaxID=7238 RepID=B4IL05_DROSE|nr:GM13149 [Drosophila sechellia]